MVVRFIGFIFALGALWNLFATFRGMALFFDLAMDFDLNPSQFAFTAIISLVLCALVIGSHYIWSTAGKDLVGNFIKAVWAIGMVFDFFASWWGTQNFIFYGERDDVGRTFGVILITLLVMIASILFAKLLLTKDVKGKPFIF